MQRTAQCHCGALRVTAVGEPEWVNACHCKACQRRTGTVLHVGSYFPETAVEITGVSKAYARPADSGYEIRFHFCPDCGSNVYWKASRFPDHWGVAVGAFADPMFPAPSFSVWQESKHPWLSLSDALPQFVQGRIGAPLGRRDPD
ncbi:MAG: GFA family protein [Alphaproteobacteria bacterium]|nr:GFA family protein [Alphaproteobacteria bacterium]